MATERDQIKAAVTAWKHGESGLGDTVDVIGDILGLDDEGTRDVVEDMLSDFESMSIEEITDEIDAEFNLDAEPEDDYLDEEEDEEDEDEEADFTDPAGGEGKRHGI